ncbi:predicted protein [Naegleria gruberi]|uniref:DNA-directed RNA polymerase III subunit RPC3 n=1 Tax=Naegleria gruberi TaxID=5762 RepID=D2VB64_NAEGR|nr:uncharacterized protein NAEGRDRAFT_66106 [Naegleria gruberi]EFC45742.1 predicted protein [Naegleria gruberi]|eukprot:XP_002678486.1 predicted protein [Naegleria gruberi strain NEG-M]
MNKRHLAVEILNDQFGDIIGKVGSVLLEQGPQTMTDLIQNTSLQFPQVRNALLVLIQHNMCVYFDKNIYQQKLEHGSKNAEEEDDMKTQTEKLREQEERREKWKHKGGGNDTAPVTVPIEEEESEQIKAEKQKQFERQSKIIYYQVIIENIIMRLKSAKLLYTIRTSYGIDAEELLHILLQHGRLTMKELIQKALENITQTDYTFATESKKTSFITAFQKMVKDRFIKRVQPYVSSIQLQEQKKNAKEGGSNSTTDLLQKYSKQNKESKKKSDKSKKRKTIEDEDGSSQYEPEKKKKKGTSSEISPLEFDTEEFDSIDEDEIHIDAENILWTTNYSQFIRTFRNESIIKYVETKMGEQFASIVKAAFDETAPYQRSKNDPMSTPLKFEKLYDRISETEEIGRKVLENNLSFLCNPELDILRAMGKDTYFINLKGVADKLKKQETEVIISQKYSVIGCRLFRLLLEKKYLEQTHIAECALLPPCEARTLLMNMLRGSILHLQEVPKSKDRSAQQTFFLWSVKLEQVYEKIIDDMYKSVRNLRIRLKKEQQHIIESGILESTYLSEEQEEQIRRLKNIEDRLEASLIKLVDLITLFEDF